MDRDRRGRRDGNSRGRNGRRRAHRTNAQIAFLDFEFRQIAVCDQRGDGLEQLRINAGRRPRRGRTVGDGFRRLGFTRLFPGLVSAVFENGVERQQIGARAKARDDAARRRRNEGMVTKTLPRVNV